MEPLKLTSLALTHSLNWLKTQGKGLLSNKGIQKSDKPVQEQPNYPLIFPLENMPTMLPTTVVSVELLAEGDVEDDCLTPSGKYLSHNLTGDSPIQ